MSYLCTRKTERTNAGAVVQLVRILACHARGRGFESRPHRKEESFETLLFLFTKRTPPPASPRVAMGIGDSRKEVGEIKKVVSLCYEYRYTTLTGKLDATSRYAYSL